MPLPKQRTPELRERMLRVAVDALESEGVGGFTTRRVAQEAANRLPAVYELFGDKAGLVRAIFFEGFRLLRRYLDRLETTDDPRATSSSSLAFTGSSLVTTRSWPRSCSRGRSPISTRRQRRPKPVRRDAARQVALELTKLDLDAHRASKLRARQQTMDALRAAIDADYALFRRTRLRTEASGASRPTPSSRLAARGDLAIGP
jgi:AcrR family transcriptional regulator